MVKPDSPIKSAAELEGKKVGITSAGSATDILARWTMADKKVKFTEVPLGGGGLVPNLLSGNVDAIVLYSPLSFKVLKDKSVRALIDYGAEVPEHLSGVWIASDKLIDGKPALIQKINNALFGAMVWLKDKSNREAAIKIISEIDEIPLPIAEAASTSALTAANSRRMRASISRWRILRDESALMSAPCVRSMPRTCHAGSVPRLTCTHARTHARTKSHAHVGKCAATTRHTIAEGRVK